MDVTVRSRRWWVRGGAMLVAISAAVSMAQPPGGPGGPGGAGGPPPGTGISPTQAKVEYPNHVEGLFDIMYANLGGFRPLKLDVYRVPGTSGRPAVVWVHGGGWAGGNPRMVTPLFGDWDKVLARLAARGYVAAGVSYRLSGEAKFPAAIQDVKAAIRFLRANADKYGIDPKRIAIWGESAGGHLASLAGTSCGVKELEGEGGNPTQSSCVQAAVDWYGPSDFSQMDAQNLPASQMKHGAANSPESGFLGCEVAKCPASVIALANPITYIKADTPPFLIMQGDADTAVPPKQSQILYDALRAKGVSAKLEFEPGENHGFAGATPPQGQQILNTVFTFLDTTLGVKSAK